MTCAEVLDAMLVTDAAALRGEGTTPLARHVRDCQLCRAAAARVLGGTEALRVALEERRTVRPLHPPAAVTGRGRRRVAIMPAAVAAAALLAFAIVRQIGTTGPASGLAGVPAATSTGPFDSARSLLLASDSIPVVSESAPSVTPTGIHAPTAADRVSAEAPVVPVIDESISDHIPEGVSVTPQPGQHAAILHTSDPKVTIVWLY